MMDVVRVQAVTCNYFKWHFNLSISSWSFNGIVCFEIPFFHSSVYNEGYQAYRYGLRIVEKEFETL